MKKRLDEKILDIDPRIADGYYTDVYFNRTKEILEKDNHNPIVRMQVFQKNDDTCVCGIDEAIAIMKNALGDDYKRLTVKALHDGDMIGAHETVMTIEGEYKLFPHLETLILGAMARRTRVATNVYRTVRSASMKTDKPVLFFPARFDIYQAQAGDGYAYDIALKALGHDPKTGGNGVSTNAQGEWWGSVGLGTIPHALIAAYEGDTVKATLKFAEYIDPKVKRIALVDFENDCVKTTLEVADAMLEKYLETGDKRYELFGVRLDTSGTMVDESVKPMMGAFKPTGVNEELVMNVYNALQNRAEQHEQGSTEYKFYLGIGIIVSGGFTSEKIERFEKKEMPVIAYGVGSSMFNGSFDFTADIVSIMKNNEWVPDAKVGRRYNPNDRMEVAR